MTVDNVKSVYVIMKIAEVCNIGCKYCYFFFHGDETYMDRPALVAQQHIDATVAFLRQGVLDLGIEELGITLHGGEPLMLGQRRFRALCESLRDGLSDVVKLQIDMQTNAILVDEEWIDLIGEFDIGVGVSLDGPAHIHDQQRVDKRGRGTHASVIQGLDRMKRAAAEGRMKAPAVISVLGEESDAREMFAYFFDELSVSTVHFLPPMMDWDAFSTVYADKVSDFYGQILALWLERGDAALTIQWVREMLASLLSSDDLKAVKRRDDAVFTIRSDGSIGQIDGLAPKHPRFRDSGFSVESGTLRAFLDSDVSREVRQAARLPEAECGTCHWASMCRGGGDPDERYGGATGLTRKSVYCDARKRICETLYDYSSRFVTPAMLDERLDRRRAMMIAS